MNTRPDNPYRGITPEELHVIIRRAHAERAEAIRQMFAALLTWRRKAAKRPHAADQALEIAACH